MKKFLNILAALMLAVFSTSCLDSNLEELELYSDCNITSGEAYWRYYGTEKIPASGELKVHQVRLPRAVSADNENNIFKIRYTTTSLNAEQAALFTEGNVVVAVTISTAATIKPIGDAPKLGVPGDWTKDNQYEVTAADGTKKTWTIVVEPYN